MELTELLLAPAERVDIIVDFSKCGHGQTFVLNNDALAPYPFGPDDAPDPRLPATTGQIMQFRVVPSVGWDDSEIPRTIGTGLNLHPGTAVRERMLMLSELASDLDNVIFGLLGGSPTNATPDNPTGGAHWDDPVTERPRAGTTEIWNIVNATGDAHPIHVHLVQFQVLGRQLFDLDAFVDTGVIIPKGPFMPPDANELFAPEGHGEGAPDSRGQQGHDDQDHHELRPAEKCRRKARREACRTCGTVTSWTTKTTT